MMAMNPTDMALAVSAIKVEQAAREAAWLIVIHAHLRSGPATTHELGVAAGIPAGRYFGRFRTLLDRSPSIRRVGERPGPTGHVNILWARVT